MLRQFYGQKATNLSSRDRVFPFMDSNLLDIKFSRIGTRLMIADRPTRRSRTSGVISLGVQIDRKGEFFETVRPLGSEVKSRLRRLHFHR